MRLILGPFVWRGTYTNLAYLLLGFPLGLAYFVFFITGFALGIGLAIMAVGFFILLLLPITAWALALFERQLAIHLLGASVPPPGNEVTAKDGGWPWLKGVLTNSVTWKGLLFLLAKFPLGLASWVFTIVVLTIVGVFVAAPILHLTGGDINIGAWQVETLRETFIMTAIGIVALVPAVHLLNGLAWLWGRFARIMLSRKASSDPTPTSQSVELAPAY